MLTRRVREAAAAVIVVAAVACFSSAGLAQTFNFDASHPSPRFRRLAKQSEARH